MPSIKNWALLNEGMNARLSGFIKAPVGPPSEGLLAWGTFRVLFPPSEGLLAWGARACLQTPRSPVSLKKGGL
ncbi:hypothetical protein BI334_25080 [Moorena producens 3L]|nr:hypothetical protein BI334_25080 [Moorena producens 3L]